MFLATTALEEFWNKNEKILFLGEWCKLHDRKEELEKLDYETLDFEWNNLEKQRDAIIYCNVVYENILDELVVILNNNHNIHQDKRYWRTLLSSWLLPFIQVTYDRYIHIKNAIDYHPNINTYTLNQSNYYIPTNFSDFNTLVTSSDIYNLQLYSQIFKILSNNYKDIDNNIRIQKKQKNYNNIVSIKEKLLRVSTKILNSVFKKDSVLIVSPGFKNNAILSILQLIIKSKFLFVFDNLQYNINTDNTDNTDNRKNIFKTNEVGFKKILFELFIYNFPKLYIENYKDFNISVNKLKINLPNLVFSSGAIYSNDIFKFFIAKNKVNLLYKQHGGGYGLELLLTSEKIERDVSTLYYTQGWTDSKQTVPLSGSVIRLNKSSNNINFIMTAMPRYFHKFNYAEDSSKMIRYIENTNNFLNNFCKSNNLTIRMYMQDYRWNIKKRLLEINKDLKFDNKVNYYKQVVNARLNIFDHMHTGYLETLSANIPTIIIIPKKIYYFRDSAQEYIQKLKYANILWEDPIEASKFVDDIYDNIDKWWLSTKVQKIREEFCYRYARTSENWAEEWVNEFTKILDNNARG